MQTELITIEEKPTIPKNWNYDESVKKSKIFVYKWKGMTIDLAKELWIARAKLSIGHRPPESGTKVPLNTWTDYCFAIGSERRIVNRWLDIWFTPQISASKPPPLLPPKGKYNIIYADPPWKYYEGGFKNQSQHYQTMELEDICQLPIGELASDDCILFMWVTFPMLDQFIDVLRCWGFEYSTVGFVWVKKNKKSDTPFIGLGNWTRSNAEICVMAKRGSIERKDASISQIVMSPIGEHSEKPKEVKEKIVKLLGDLPRIELFARQKENDGWHYWGNEI